MTNSTVRIFALFILCLTLFVGCQKAVQEKPFDNGSWIDLSYVYDENTIYWPTADGFELDTAFEGETEGGYYYSAFNIKTAEHGGTHLDAPIHFAKGGQSSDQLRLDQLTGEAVVIDVSASANVDYLVSVSDFEKWEATHGKLADEIIVLIKTGHGQYWPDAAKYLGTTEKGPGAVPKLHFPGLAPEAATWLVENRKIKAIGLDTPSIDYGQSSDFRSHRILFKENIPAFENVANLDKLPATGAYVVALPMKIKGGSGGPLRIAAFVQHQQ